AIVPRRGDRAAGRCHSRARPVTAVTPRRLTPAEDRRALLGAGGGGLLHVLAPPAGREGTRDLLIAPAVEHELVVGEGQRGEVGDLPGPGQGGVEVAAPVNQSVPQRLVELGRAHV